VAWTYSGDPNTSAKDEVRFLVGDTDSTDQLVQDEEIGYVLSVHAAVVGSINYQAAAEVADAIAAKFARKRDRSIGALSDQAEQQYQHYVELAARLRTLAATGGLAEGVAVPGIPILSGGGNTYLQGDWP
jgi:hypothetical protein